MLVVVNALRAVEHMRPEGYMDAIVGSGVVRNEPGVGEVVDIPDAAYWDLVRTYSPAEFHERVSLYACGPGCQLKKSLAWWGIRSDGSCGCDSYAAQMDAWGPDECEAREDDILGHLAEAAVRRGLPFVPLAARLLIRQAIANARKEAANATQAAQEAAADVAGAGAG